MIDMKRNLEATTQGWVSRTSHCDRSANAKGLLKPKPTCIMNSQQIKYATDEAEKQRALDVVRA